MNTSETARLILAEATVLAIDIGPAIRALNEALSGWPTQTPMAGPAEPADTRDYDGWCEEPERIITIPGQSADDPTTFQTLTLCDKPRPCPDHDTAVNLTTPEAGSIHTDRARHDLERMNTAINQANRHLRIATNIAHRHATVRIDDTSVKTRLAAADAIWCTNCAQHGHMNPRRPGGTVCEYCAQFKTQYPSYKCYPPKAVLDIWSTRGKVLPTDVHRIMRDLKAKAKQVKRQEKNPDWRTRPDPARRLPAPEMAPAEQRAKRIAT